MKTTETTITITWAEAAEYVGHPYDGTDPADDRALISALLAAGAPSWVATAEGYDDEVGVELRRSPASAAAAVLGRKGGAARTPAQAAAGRRNGARGGRPRKVHVPSASAAGLRGPALCGRPASYGTGDHTLIRAQAREGGDHWCGECLHALAGPTTYTLTSCKGTWTVTGTLAEARTRARELQAEYQAAYGITVARPDGRVVYTAK